MLKAVQHNRPDGGHAYAAANEEELLALPQLVGEGAAERSSHAHLVALAQAVDGRGHLACLHDGELQIVLLGRRRIDDEGGFAGAKDRKLTHLAGLEGEVLRDFRIVQGDAYGLDVRGLGDDLEDCSLHGLVGIAGIDGPGNDFCKLGAVLVGHKLDPGLGCGRLCLGLGLRLGLGFRLGLGLGLCCGLGLAFRGLCRDRLGLGLGSLDLFLHDRSLLLDLDDLLGSPCL